MQEQLWKIFDNINFWLDYAERKNSLLLTILGLQITAVNVLPVKIDWLMRLSIGLLFICFLVTLFSFFPRTKYKINNFVSSRKQISPSDNLLFYDDIAKYSAEEYFAEIGKCFTNQVTDNRYLKDLCLQIIVNSKIVSSKFKIFKLTSWLMVIGQAVFFLSILI